MSLWSLNEVVLEEPLEQYLADVGSQKLLVVIILSTRRHFI